MRKILVATDFSESARAALEQAGELARALHASLDLVHVWEVPAFLPGELLVADGASLLDLVKNRAQERMAALVADAERDGIHPSAINCVLGVPHAAIVDAAVAGGHDLIVLGSHGRTGLSRVLLGSVAERVVRHAPCTVVVARQPS